MHFVKAKGILSSKNGMNLYRGCSHGCIYCDSRSKCYHFEHPFEDIEVKENALELLEYALMRSLGLNAANVAFDKTADGKWTCRECEFSLSHKDDLVAVAVSRSPVGIDIEKIDAERFDEKLQARILTPAERSALSRLAASERSLRANILWTEKEALFKRDNGKLFAANKLETANSHCKTIIVKSGEVGYYLSVVSVAECVCSYNLTNVVVG